MSDKKSISICSVADVHIPMVNVGLVTEPADILTVSGDLTAGGSIAQLRQFRTWLDAQPQKHKVIIAGNHDFCLQNKQSEAESILVGDGIHYLRDSSVTIDGIKFYGSPWQPWFYDWAFNLNRGSEIAAKWALIPDDIDVFLVHGPPRGYGDLTCNGDRAGCDDLLAAIKVKKPRYTLYGHIHEDTGQWNINGSILVNCSIGYAVGNEYWPVRNPYRFDIDPR